MQRRVLICGYPKSGNTWLTRLTADLISCPFAGFWKSREKIIRTAGVEGEDRPSDLVVYKTHRRVKGLLEELEPQDVVISVVRDPRDVLISARHHFAVRRFPGIRKFLRKRPSRRWLLNAYESLCQPRPRPLSEMADMMIHGGGSTDEWLRAPWNEYMRETLQAGGCLVRYEDLLAHPQRECQRILDAVGIERSEEEMTGAIERQSFSRRKKDFEQQGKAEIAKAMRKGQAGQWKKEVPPELIAKLEAAFSAEMQQLGYELSASA